MMPHKICALLAKPALLLASVTVLLSFSSFADEKLPTQLEDIGIDDHTGSHIDLNLNFKDESGQNVKLQNYFHNGKPVLFFLVYYECPNLCNMVLNEAVDSLKEIKWSGDETSKYEIVAVSIDPKETPALAQTKKQSYLKVFGRAGDGSNWHFLTGNQAAITPLANEVGFKYKWDEEQKQFAHASAMFVLTPEGKLSRYFYGLDFPSSDLKFAMLEASQGKIGTLVDKIVLFCYHYDTSTKKYVLMAGRLMTGGGIVTVVFLGLFFGRLWFLNRNRLRLQRG